ncbi:PE-PPE domain-containing protein [Streptomyces sp. WMMB 322]|uniref:cutinase family protein n=1 Tax=Streptomyces sp. WMMB 322 TaxID=1286821 RepID=UPI0006E19962|nr:PE-PPE domain-containing protein [Streptomyces sp. WMMB 322]SCK37787.1 PE-PPE domain-containing protein [Streptomyces sp. WMMB 322]
MARTSKVARSVRAAVLAAALAAGTTVAFPSAAQAAGAEHYYIEIGGTGPTVDQDGCPTANTSYDTANKALGLGSSAIKVCYPASAGPLIGPTGGLVEPPAKVNPEALTAPTYDASVRLGVERGLQAAKDTHKAHPGARITITGYSQGAQAADEVLQRIASGSTGIPLSQVDGVLYADPMQPETGLGAHLPRGLGIPGVATSPGAGPAEFNGIPVTRYCIVGDPVCDLRSVTNAPGYFSLHPKYPEAVIPKNLTRTGQHGVRWLNANGDPV